MYNKVINHLTLKSHKPVAHEITSLRTSKNCDISQTLAPVNKSMYIDCELEQFTFNETYSKFMNFP